MAGVQPPGASYDVAAAVYAANVIWAVDAAKGSEIKLVLESINPHDVPGFFLRTQEQGAALVEAIGPDRVGLQFDIYHCQVAQGDVTRRMEKLMPLIAHMQLADAPGRNEPGRARSPGTTCSDGSTNWTIAAGSGASTGRSARRRRLAWRKRYGL